MAKGFILVHAALAAGYKAQNRFILLEAGPRKASILSQGSYTPWRSWEQIKANRRMTT